MVTEKELSELLGAVEKEFSEYLAKAEQSVDVKTEETVLAKSEDSDKKEKPEAKEEKKEDKPEAKADEAPKSDDKAPPAEAPESEEAPAAPADAAPAADAAAAPALPDEGHGYDDEDMAHMQAMYASMSRAELIAHHDAIKAVLDGMTAEQAPAAPAADAAPAAPAAPVDKCGDMSMVKSEQETAVEVKPDVIVNSKETEILKSEIEAAKAKNEELQKTLDVVTQFVTKLVEKRAAPAGKAITQLEAITKSDSTPDEKTPNKEDITAKLTLKASDPKLAKSDREAINAYYATGQININGISHLLK
jgi:hypothetical protein